MKIAACVSQCGKQLPKNPEFHRVVCSPVFCWNVCCSVYPSHSPFDKDVASEKGFCTCKCSQVGSESRLYHWVPVEQASALMIVISTICYQLSCMWMGQGLWEFSETPGLLVCVCVRHPDCRMLAQLRNKTSLGKPSGYQTFSCISLHLLLYTFNSTCHGPGRQLLIPESQHCLWFPLVALIKGKEGKKFFKAEWAIWD